MADRIVVEGVRRYDGEYDFDIVGEPLTTLEWRWIKKISGYLPLTIKEGWEGQDPDLILAFGVIAMRRDGKIDKDAVLQAASALEDGASISIVFDEAVEADPPQAPETPLEQSSQSAASGVPSSPTSDPPGPTPSATGSQGSERSAASDPLTLVI